MIVDFGGTVLGRHGSERGRPAGRRKGQQRGRGRQRGAVLQEDLPGAAIDYGEVPGRGAGGDVAGEAVEGNLEVDDHTAAVRKPDPRRVGDDPPPGVRRNVRRRLIHLPRARGQRRCEEGGPRLLGGQLSLGGRNSLGHPRELTPLLIDEARLADRPRVEHLQVAESPVRGISVDGSLLQSEGLILGKQQVEAPSTFEVGGERRRHLLGVPLRGPTLLTLLSERTRRHQQAHRQQHDSDHQREQRRSAHGSLRWDRPASIGRHRRRL